MGAAVIAGVGAGIFPDFSSADQFISTAAKIAPADGAPKLYADLKERTNALYQALSPLFGQ